MLCVEALFAVLPFNAVNYEINAAKSGTLYLIVGDLLLEESYVMFVRVQNV